ncbi:MAG: hypothetical protein ABIY37_10755 [Devosia sp.]
MNKALLVAMPLVMAALLVRPAFACACCTNVGDRLEWQASLDEYDLVILDELEFADRAEVAVGEQDYEDVDGIDIGSLPLTLAVAKAERIWTFAFADGTGNSGKLQFQLPDTIERFEVDPRDPLREPPGIGPALYKEWRLTAAAVGSGLLTAGVGDEQTATLIIHGWGNRCPSSADFNAWSLVLDGPKAQVTIFGDLVL